MEKREIPLVVLSDLHLGTFGCRAKEINQYLKSIKPEKLVLNGDIIDIWQFRKNYFPKSHLKVLKQFMAMAAKGTELYYITGNHDESLRRFSDLKMGNMHLVDKLVLNLPQGKAWIFHGDIFDSSIQSAKWLAKLGGWGYDLLIAINSLSNWLLEKMGKERYSFSKKIKNSVKKAVTYIDDFENTAAELAIEQSYRYVICGHIHQAQMREVQNQKGSCTYLNSGDWIENLTALEFDGKDWSIYQHDQKAKENDSVEMEESALNDLSLARIMEKVKFDDPGIAI